MHESQTVPPRRPGNRWNTLRSRYLVAIEPRTDGLPRYRVLLSFPALLLIFGAILVGVGLNGTSSGAMRDLMYTSQDPQLVVGHPQLIRSDEWYVTTAWSISQVQLGLPERNSVMPGGMDAALPQNLPRLDWSVALQPQLWGYMIMDVGHATAWKWWMPALALMAAAFCFLVTLLPRRPILSAALAVGFFYNPFFQWWFQSVMFWSVAWGLTTMTALIWAIKNHSSRSRWGWAAVVAFLTATMAMGIYAPFIIPVVLVVAFFFIGFLVERKQDGPPWLELLKKVAPLLSGGAAGALVTFGWLQSERVTVDSFLSTAYPGERLTPTGASNLLSLARAIGSSFSESLSRGGGFLGTNSSEASTFFFIGVFMLPIAGWIVWRAAQQRKPLPWALIGLCAAVVLFIAFFYIPGWDRLAHILFLDRTTEGRTRIGFGLASFAILGYIIRSLDSHRAKAGMAITVITAGLFLLSQAAIAAAIVVVAGPGKLWHDSPLWWAYAVVSAAAIFFFSRRRFALGAVAFALVTVTATIAVNPVYLGVFDLRTTPVAKEIVQVQKADPGTWVGMGGPEVTALLLETGTHALNGTQGAPSQKMWREIDPTGSSNLVWNRLAGVNWEAGTGEPTMTNPAPDQILVTFDACSSFAQKNVDYVLSDHVDLSSPCLKETKSFDLPVTSLTIYRVVERTP
jgi:hypothetical protein